jgi:hypothetical protein
VISRRSRSRQHAVISQLRADAAGHRLVVRCRISQSFVEEIDCVFLRDLKSLDAIIRGDRNCGLDGIATQSAGAKHKKDDSRRSRPLLLRPACRASSYSVVAVEPLSLPQKRLILLISVPPTPRLRRGRRVAQAGLGSLLRK